MVLHGRHDPAVEAVTGPLCQYAAEWWRVTDPSNPSGTAFSAGFLVEAFQPVRHATATAGGTNARSTLASHRLEIQQTRHPLRTRRWHDLAVITRVAPVIEVTCARSGFHPVPQGWAFKDGVEPSWISIGSRERLRSCSLRNPSGRSCGEETLSLSALEKACLWRPLAGRGRALSSNPHGTTSTFRRP